MPIILDIDQAKVLRRKKRIKRLQPVKSPVQAERDLRIRTEQLWARVIFPSLERIKTAIDSGMGQEQLANLLEYELNQAQWAYGAETGEIVDMWRLAVDRRTRAKLNAALGKSLGIDITAVLDEPEVAEALSMGAWEAEQLIVTMPTKVMGDVADAVMKNMRGVPLPEGRNLMEQIDFLGTRSKKWAKFIARDQTAKLTSVLNQTRQQALGVEDYVWRTVQDNRVVGNPFGNYPIGNDKHGNHYMMEGVTCKWGDVTVYSTDDGKTWKKRTSEMPKDTPGNQIQCRCTAAGIMDLDKILERALLQ